MSHVQAISLAALAQAAGVSVATASRALRNDPRQCLATRQRVQSLARRLGYRPHPMVTALMTQIRVQRRKKFAGTLALLDPWPQQHGWGPKGMIPLFLEGVHRRAGALGYGLDEIWLGRPGMTPERTENVLRTRGVLGLVIAPFPFDRVHHVLPLDVRNFAVATMGYSLKTPDLHRACINHYASMALALDQMRRRGYRRIGFVITERLSYRANGMLTAGYLTWQQAEPIEQRIPHLLLPDDAPEAEHREIFSRWLRQHRPDAVLDYYCPVFRWLKALGLRVPHDIGFATLGQDLGVSIERARGQPSPSGVDLDWRGVGEATVDLVVEQINRNERGAPTMPRLTLVPGRWNEGETLRPVPAAATLAPEVSPA
jgi:LacI family transcriptional regulator